MILVISTDLDSDEYFSFKVEMQKRYPCYADIKSVKNLYPNIPKYADKLFKAIQDRHAVVVICSEALNNYLNGGKAENCDLLKEYERIILKKGFSEYTRKFIPVSFDESGKEFVPFGLKEPLLIDLEDGDNDNMCILAGNINSK